MKSDILNQCGFNKNTTAVDFWLRVRSGAAERPLYDALMAKVDGANFGRIEVLGIPRPTFGLILEEGRLLCSEQREFIMRTVLDDIQKRAQEAYVRETELLAQEQAGGEKYVSPLGLETDRRTAHLKRQVAQALLSGDQRVLSLTPEQRASLLVTTYGTSQMTVGDLYAQAGMLDVGMMEGTSNNGTLVFGQKIETTLNDYINSNTDRPFLNFLTEQNAPLGSGGSERIEEKETPNNKNTMVIVIYGSNQFPGDGVSGFEDLTLNLLRTYQETWPFSIGENLTAGKRGVLPEEAYEEIRAFVQSRSEQNPHIKYVLIIGHSWGGGAAYELSSWITNTSGLKIKIVGVIYVDAITLNGTSSEQHLPPGAMSMLNIFQAQADIDTFFAINGNNIVDRSHLADFQEINYDAFNNDQTHISIDENSVFTILDFIRSHVPLIP